MCVYDKNFMIYRDSPADKNLKENDRFRFNISFEQMSDFRHMHVSEMGYYIAIIGDEDTVTGFLLTGIGQMEADGTNNFLVVRPKTTIEEIENAFNRFTAREDVAILLINQHIAAEIRPLIEKFERALPAILEIPSKDHPYNPEVDPVFKRVSALLGMA